MRRLFGYFSRLPKPLTAPRLQRLSSPTVLGGGIPAPSAPGLKASAVSPNPALREPTPFPNRFGCRGCIMRTDNAASASRCSGPGLASVNWIFLFGFYLFLFSVLCPLSSAWAHAFPDHSEPRVGSTIKASPKTVRIWFDGHLEPVFSTIEVYDEDQKRVDREDGRVSPSEPTLLEVSLPPLSSGRYRVVWGVVAVDGHRTEGDFSFTIEAAP